MRYHRYATYALTDDVDTTPQIEWGNAEYGMVYVPAGSSVTTLTFHCAPDYGATYEPAFDAAAAAITLTVAADQAVALPSGLRGSGWFKAVVNADGSVIMSFQE